MGLNIKPKHIVLDLYQNKYVMIQASQYDIDSRKLIIHVTSDGEFFKIPQNYVASIEYKKPDNTIGVVDCEILEDGTLSFTITDQMVAVPGYCKCDLLLASNKEAVNTGAFIINVRESAVQGDEIESKDEFTSLTKTITRARSAISTMSKMQEEMSNYVEESNQTIDRCLAQMERAEDIANQVDEAVLTAIDKAGETAINAKAASSSATSAQSSANKAKTSETNAKSYYEQAKAVADAYDEKNLEWKTIAGSSGITVDYNSAFVRIYLNLGGYSLSAGSSDSTTYSLPSNVIPKVDRHLRPMVLTSTWQPTNVEAYICLMSGTNKIQIRSNTTLSNNVLMVDVIYPRHLFDINV